MQSSKKIYFHVGLGKTGTTYLQYRFFPKLRGLKYIQRTKFHKPGYQQLIESSNETKFLVSYEMDRQLERECKKFSDLYPETRPIIVFRKHSGWIASQYRRNVKNGRSHTFKQFFDIDNNQGEWDINEANYMHKIDILNSYFRHKPLVLFHNELLEDPIRFFDRLAQFMEVSYNKKKINLHSKHSSYNEKQLRVIFKFSNTLFKQHFKYHKSITVARVQRILRMIPRYLILYAASFTPKKWVPDNPVLEKTELEKIDHYFNEDWEQIHEYARNNNTI